MDKDLIKEYLHRYEELHELYDTLPLGRVIEVIEGNVQPSSLQMNEIRNVSDAYQYISDWNRKVKLVGSIYDSLCSFNPELRMYDPNKFEIKLEE